MASSSLSQEDVDHDLEVQCSRRSRIRTARAATRTAAPLAVRDPSAPDCEALECDHDASPKPRAKDKRCPRPPNNKCKAQRERRKLREKRRSTGVVHLQSTESTGGSTGEEEELLSMSAETRRNTALNEGALHPDGGPSPATGRTPAACQEVQGTKVAKRSPVLRATSDSRGDRTTETYTERFMTIRYDGPHLASSLPRPFARPCKCRNNKSGFTLAVLQSLGTCPSHNDLVNRTYSPSDLDADDEDNQEYDSAVNQSDRGRLTEGPPPALLSPRPCWAGGDHSNNDQEEETRGNNPLHRALGEAERVQEEVRRLVQLLKEKELRIHSLERRVLALAKELNEVTAENRELREMNNALLDGVPLAMQPPAKE